MSYLLTEIALDMLGYKFYDIHGTYRITDFQSTTSPTDSEEKSLEDIIYPKDGTSQNNEINTIDSDDECVEVPSLPIPSITVNQDELILQNIRESIDKEVECLRKEINQQKTKFIEENIELLRKTEKPKEILVPYNKSLTKNLQKEAELLGCFLKNVELKLDEANPDQFKELKKYRMDEFL